MRTLIFGLVRTAERFGATEQTTPTMTRTTQRQAAMDFDIIIKFDQPGVRYSFDGGKNWLHIANRWDTYSVVIKQIVNTFAVYKILNPPLDEGTYLCHICASKARVGVMKFHLFTYGKEAQATLVYPPDGGEPYMGDVYHSCRYRIDRCNRCGHEESDYG